MRLFAPSFLSFALAAGMAIPAQAAPYELDKSHTAITFQVDHLGYSLVHGFFTQFDADIDFDPDKPEESSVTFTIDAASINTLWEKRDEHIRNKDFLDVSEHPEIVFTSKSIEMTGDDTATLVGDLTIVGVTNEETFEVTLRKTAPSPFNKKRIISGFAVEGTIDRTDYGVDYASPVVGNEIPVRVDLEIYPAE